MLLKWVNVDAYLLAVLMVFLSCLKSIQLSCRYVAWNLHEEIKGQFNFDGILDLG